ncbi:MAG: repeat containing protein [Flavipsychrobacter sp.]|jgi:sugar lactone lactonase YvrE|nr:repeat containing protein [Flavipsychrobacter sp.]
MNTSKLLCCSLLVFFLGINANGQTIKTIAGDGVTQYIGDGSPATAYSLAFPRSIYVNKKGEVYVADYFNERIRKIFHDTISTVVGTGIQGYSGDGGPASAAELGNPDGICMDTAGNMYITEFYNNTIRKVNAATKVITTICGNGTAGYSGNGGPATAAQFQSPYKGCVDLAGNIYIADYENHRVRKFTAATGIISTIAGNGLPGFYGDYGPATAAKLYYPSSVAIDRYGNLYISEFGNHTIRKINAATGVITTIAGTTTAGYTGDGSLAIGATLNQPNCVFVDKFGYVYISDFNNNVIRAIHPKGIMSTIAGTGGVGYTGDGGPATAATFRGPSAVFVDDSLYIYIADGDNSVIRKMQPVDTFTEESISKVGLEKVNPITFNIYPNPSSGKFTISAEFTSDAVIEVYNAIGQIIYSTTVQGHQTDVDLQGLPAGIYIVQYISGGQRAVQRAVVR